MAARRAYRNYDWKKTLEYCHYLSQLDPTMSEAAFCYVSSLVILGHKRVLFRLAHKWVEAAPKSARAWFAVGAYYYCIERYHVAQRHFSRATRLDPQCSEAWIAFGCSFAACDESDQALASFRAAHRLSPGDHSALLYMGMEYVRTNHLPLATHFLESALAASAGDPLCLHELGVLCLQKGNKDEDALSWFRRALTAAFGKESLEDCIELCNDPYWEPTLFNLGHCYRRRRCFREAELCYRRCNALCPNNHSSLSALAFVNLHTNDIDQSIEFFHKALAVKPNDSLSTDMLSRVLKLQVSIPVRKTDLRALKSRDNKRHVKPTFAVSSALWGLKDDSVMSEGADSDFNSDIDMSGDSQ
jgi:anaphase-promoting complex subunit 6